MERVVQFLKEAETYYLATVEGDQPRVRPFGTAHIFEGRMEGNVIMSEGLVLQDVDVWYDSTKIPTTPHNNMTELYFEDNDIEGIIKKLESGKYVVSYVTELTELEGGQKLMRFYDPSGNLIEVRTPINYN